MSVKWKILRLFVKAFTADNKSSLLNRGNLLQHFQLHLTEKRKTFSNFSLHFLNLDSVLNVFEKNMTLIADVFVNLRTPKDVAN